MTENNNITPIGEAPVKAPRAAFLKDYPLTALETDWIVQGRVNKRFIERTLQDLIGTRNRKDYAAVINQIDTLADGIDSWLAAGESEEEVKRCIGTAALASVAIATAAMPGAFVMSID